MSRTRLTWLSLCLLLVTGCSSQRLAVRFISPVFDPMMQAIFAETDLQVAQSAMESDILLLEGLLRMAPDHRDNRLRLAQLLTGYSLICVEPVAHARAVDFYRRGAEAAGLAFKDPGQCALLTSGTRAEYEQTLRELDRRDHPALFWWAFATGARLRLQLDDPAAIMLLPRVEAVMQWCVEVDPAYFFGGGLLWLGAVAATRPVLLGGDLVAATALFAQAATLNRDQLLLVDVYRARYLCTANFDENGFRVLLRNVIQSEPESEPEHLHLLNSFARSQARTLLETVDEYF